MKLNLVTSLLVYCLLSLQFVAAETTLTLLNGTVKTGELLEISSANLRLTTDGSSIEIATDQIERVNFKNREKKLPDRESQRVSLVDGSSFSTSQFSITRRSASFALAGSAQIELAPLEIETRNIDWIRTNITEAIDKPWRTSTSTEIKSDALLILKEGEIDSLEGLIQGVDDSTIQFKFDGDLIAVKRSKVSGLRFYHAAGRKFPETLCSIETVAGNRFMAKAVSAKSGKLAVTLVCDNEIELPLDSLIQLDFSVGKILYVSEIKQIAHQWAPQIDSGDLTSQLGQLMTWQRDRNLQKRPLNLFSATSFSDSNIGSGSKRVFARGIAVRSGTKLAFDVPADFKTLTGLAGIDPAVRPQGHVELTISADGKKLYSKEIGGQDPEPQAIEVDVRGVKRLVFHIDYGNNSDIADHLNLCNLRLSR